MSHTVDSLILELYNTNRGLPIFMEDEEGHRTIPEPDLHSWRGIYAEPSIDPYEGTVGLTVDEFIRGVSSAVGEIRHGYKGGEFVMYGDDIVYADIEGTCPGYTIVKVVEYEDSVVLLRALNSEEED